MLKSPAGAVVGIFVDLAAPVLVGDMIETGTGRRYRVLVVRVQRRGLHVGRQHLRCVVLAPNDRPTVALSLAITVHRIRWYSRG